MVTNKRNAEGFIRRRRKCENCSFAVTTKERIEEENADTKTARK